MVLIVLMVVGNCILIDAGYTIMLDKQTNWDTQHCSGCGKVILGGVSDEEDVFVRKKQTCQI